MPLCFYPYFLLDVLIEMGKLRHGIIGFGGIGREHARSAKVLEEYELVAVAEVNVKLGRKAEKEFGVKWYRDYLEMLEREELDTVSICTPHFLHRDMTVEAASAGVNVLVEKPMAITVKQADEMIEAARRAGIVLGVVFQWRFTSVAQEARKLVGNGELGNLLYASMQYYCYRTQSYYNMGAWRGTWRGEGGGVLINQAIHFIDAFQRIVGQPIKRVSAFADTLAHDIEVEDVAVAAIEFDNRAKGFMYMTSFHIPEGFILNAQGTRGALKISDKKIELIKYDLNLLETIYAKVEGWGIRPQLIRQEIVPQKPDPRGHEAVFKDFARAVMGDGEPAVPGEEGRKSIEIINAIIMSTVKGRPVSLPVDPLEYEQVYRELVKKKSLRAAQP